VRARDRQARGCLVCNSVTEVRPSDGSVGPVLTRVLAHRTRVVERLFRRAVAGGEIPPPTDVPAAARMFVTFLVGLNTLSRVVRSERALWATCLEFLRGWGVNGATVLGTSRRRGGSRAR
jgi:TetR/AcrR family transcriptional repressor of nem operon